MIPAGWRRRGSRILRGGLAGEKRGVEDHRSGDAQRATDEEAVHHGVGDVGTAVRIVADARRGRCVSDHAAEEGQGGRQARGASRDRRARRRRGRERGARWAGRGHRRRARGRRGPPGIHRGSPEDVAGRISKKAEAVERERLFAVRVRRGIRCGSGCSRRSGTVCAADAGRQAHDRSEETGEQAAHDGDPSQPMCPRRAARSLGQWRRPGRAVHGPGDRPGRATIHMCLPVTTSNGLDVGRRTSGAPGSSAPATAPLGARG